MRARQTVLRLRGEFNRTITALFLGGIHGAVGTTLDGINAAPVFGVTSESDADTGCNAFAFEFQWGISYGLHDPLGDFYGAVGSGLRQQSHELVTTVARENIGMA